MKHDPLPWTYELTDSMADDEDAFVIQSPDGDVAEICSPALTAEANAALICRAVNSHAELLDALERIAAHDPETCDGITPKDCLDVVREIARAALVAAR